MNKTIVVCGIVFVLVLAGVLVGLWRRRGWGYLLAGIFLTFGLMMFITIPAWIVVPLLQDGKVNALEAAPFLVLCLLGFVLAGSFFRSIKEGSGERG